MLPINFVKKICDEDLDTPYEVLSSKSRLPEYVKKRQLIYALLRTKRIGRTASARLFNRDHSTIIKGLRDHHVDLKYPEYRTKYVELCKKYSRLSIDDEHQIDKYELIEYKKELLIRLRTMKGMTINETLIEKII